MAIYSENLRLVAQGIPTKANGDRAFGLQNDCSGPVTATKGSCNLVNGLVRRLMQTAIAARSRLDTESKEIV